MAQATRLLATCAHCQVEISHASGIWWQAGTLGSSCPVAVDDRHCPTEAWLMERAVITRDQALAAFGFGPAEPTDLHDPVQLEAWLAS